MAGIVVPESGQIALCGRPLASLIAGDAAILRGFLPQ